MPRLNGYEACRRIREFSTAPIIMLTALAEEADKVKGLDYGADDYVTKPFSAGELLARVRAALRRGTLSEQPESQSTLRLGELRIEFVQQRVFLSGREVNLSPTEFRLLRELARHAGQVLSHDHLLKTVWGEGYAGEEHLVPKVIHRLRQKIERNLHDPRYIQTKPGLGYLLSDQPH